MALVFKIKFNDTIRRWIVYDNLNSSTFSLTLTEVEAKIRELFSLSQSTTLAITYTDKDNDVITIGDDQDLVDACFVQCLNPLRLNVSEKPGSFVTGAASESASQPRNLEVFLKTLFPQATADVLQSFMKTYHRFWDPMLPTETLVQKAQEAFRSFLGGFSSPQTAQETLRTSQPAANSHVVRISDNDHRNSGFACTDASFVSNHGHHGVFHRRIQCDGCGINPIEGTRYKSTKIPNYDLCSTCYAEMGNDAEFMRLEHPVISYHPSFGRRGTQWDVGQSSRRTYSGKGPYAWKSECPFSGQVMSHPIANGQKKKLDSRFVKDVSIFDGSELLPSSRFKKVWRLRNSGNIPWPQGTQLAHIGGDVLGSIESVDLELPEGGLSCGEDIDISVDLTAPNSSGRYVSHWRLVSPSGQKFGHRVWVLIQVVSQCQQFPELEAKKGMEKTVDEGLSDQAGVVRFDEMNPNDEETETSSPTSLDDYSNQSTSVTDINVVDEGLQENELDGFSLIEAPVDDIALGNIINAETFGVIQGKEMHEEGYEGKLLLLESMGFLNMDLNLQLLKKNHGDIQDTLDDLLLCDGWDSILKNLEEMGFTDRNTNVLLLLENQGSIKQVVKDLVRMEKK